MAHKDITYCVSSDCENKCDRHISNCDAEPTHNKTSNALNALEQDNADFFTKGHLHLEYAEEGK